MDTVTWARSVALMLDAGQPLDRALEVAWRQTRPGDFQTALVNVHQGVSGGRRFSEALQRYGDVFPRSLVDAAWAGEEAGTVARVLHRWCDVTTREGALRGKVLGALVYPAVVLLSAAGVLTFLLQMIVPKFARIFASHGADLPALTQGVLALSDALRSPLPWLVLSSVAFGALVLARLTGVGREQLERLLLQVPFLGRLLQSHLTTQLCGHFALFLGAGAKVDKAMDLCARLTSWRCLRTALEGARASVVAGGGIADGLKAANLFPDDALRLVEAGEETDQLERTLEEAASLHALQADAGSTVLVGVLEPAFILVLGLLIGTLVISMYLPVFSMAQAVSRG